MAEQNRNFFVSKVDFDFFPMIEDGLTAIITSKLLTKIKKFKKTIMVEI